jgi:hypothetical protein
MSNLLQKSIMSRISTLKLKQRSGSNFFKQFSTAPSAMPPSYLFIGAGKMAEAMIAPIADISSGPQIYVNDVSNVAINKITGEH